MPIGIQSPWCVFSRYCEVGDQMRAVNDAFCPNKTLCDRVSKTHNYRNALIYAALIDYLIPIIVFIVGIATSVIMSVSVFPISIIVYFVLGTFSIILGIAVFIANLICLILLFREIGVLGVLPLVAWGIGIVLLLTIIGIPLALFVFFVPWAVIAVAIHYYILRDKTP